MELLIVSYSLTGNNNDLAISLAKSLKAENIVVTESKMRTMSTIIFDLLLNRVPKITLPEINAEDYNMVIFVGPVWMGNVATPLRLYFKKLRLKIKQYAFISISGGADGPNPKLAAELKKRLGKEPVALIDMHIADLLAPEPKPTRDDTMHYRINEKDVNFLTAAIISELNNLI